MQRRGFTLIELLIVIAIVAILAGAMVPMFRVTRRDAQDAKVGADLDAIKTASIMMHHDTTEWPVDGDNGEDLVTDTSSYADWNGPYLDDWRQDPWGSSYVLGTISNVQRVTSWGPDTTSGGGDDIDIIITPDISI